MRVVKGNNIFLHGFSFMTLKKELQFQKNREKTLITSIEYETIFT